MHVCNPACMHMHTCSSAPAHTLTHTHTHTHLVEEQICLVPAGRQQHHFERIAATASMKTTRKRKQPTCGSAADTQCSMCADAGHWQVAVHSNQLRAAAACYTFNVASKTILLA